MVPGVGGRAFNRPSRGAIAAYGIRSLAERHRCTPPMRPDRIDHQLVAEARARATDRCGRSSHPSCFVVRLPAGQGRRSKRSAPTVYRQHHSRCCILLAHRQPTRKYRRSCRGFLCLGIAISSP